MINEFNVFHGEVVLCSHLAALPSLAQHVTH